MTRYTNVLYLAGMIIVGGAIFIGTHANKQSSSTTALPTAITATPTKNQSPLSQNQPSLVEPVNDFKQRVTKKPFGIYITPQNSPVQPERFTGYHTGADAEYADVAGEVPVKAIASGKVILARWASGYGGVIAIQHTINNQSVIAIYGHIKPSSLPVVGKIVTAGQQIGVLGQGGTIETDGERRHLHFGLVRGTAVTLKGYVMTKTELTKWIDPLTLFKE